MIELEVRSARGDYTVVVGTDLLAAVDELLRSRGHDLPRSLVSDTTVGPIHGRPVAVRLGLDPLELPPGEANKRWDAVETTIRHWLDRRLDRTATALALGGGIITDIVGFAAATYLRGIDWIAAPTTLLGMVDAAVGGKTGVNLHEGKNLIGAFWPPRLVIADISTLRTLPGRELRAGLAEVVKAAWIGDRGLLDLVPDTEKIAYDSLGSGDWQNLVARAVAVKTEIVVADERETGRRKALNLGHTLGHALEAATGYERFLHGEAVAWGLEAAAILARRRGLLGAGAETALRTAIRRLGDRPPITDLDPETVCGFIAVDKKRDATGVGWVLPTDDGVMIGQIVTKHEAIEAFRQIQLEASEPKSIDRNFTSGSH
jgi:3-dehydroquinate synthase